LVLTQEPDQTLRVWELATGKEACRLGSKMVNGNGINSATFAPDGKTVAAVVTNMDGTAASIHVWDVKSGKELRKLAPPEPKENEQPYMPNAIRFSPRGKWLLVM